LVVLDVSQHRPKLVVWTIRRGSAAKVNPRVVNPPSLHPPSHPGTFEPHLHHKIRDGIGVARIPRSLESSLVATDLERTKTSCDRERDGDIFGKPFDHPYFESALVPAAKVWTKCSWIPEAFARHGTE
jgi:hypothetical protein